MRLFLCIGGNYVKTQKINSVTSDFVLGLTLMPTTAFAEAGDWDPTTPKEEVMGQYKGFQSSQPSSTTLKVGNPGYLRMMPTLSIGNYE